MDVQRSREDDVTGHAGSAAPPQGDGLADDEEVADEAVPPLPRRVPGQARKFWPSREPGDTTREPGTSKREPGDTTREAGDTTGEPGGTREGPGASKREAGTVKREPGAMKTVPARSLPATRALLLARRAVAGKPTPAELGIDLATLEWECSGDGEGRIEVAFPSGPASGEATWSRGEWVLMRVTGDMVSRVLVFDRNEWECFLDGVRNGEFDDAV